MANCGKNAVYPAMSRHPTILIAIDPWPGYRRELISGALQYAKQHTAWRLLPDWRQSYRNATAAGLPPVDGMLTIRQRSPLVAELMKRGVPAVGIHHQSVDNVMDVTVHRDSAAIGRMAFDHLAGLGFKHLACIDIQATVLMHEEFEAFVAAADEAGIDCRTRVLDAEFRYQDTNLIALTGQWEQWVRDLPRPIGIYSPRLEIARTIAFACHRQGVLVPEEVAILGGAGDDLASGLSIPPISSVDRNLQASGYEGARLLDLLLRGKPLPDPPTLIKPLGIIQRQSTDILAIDHPAVAQAMRVIRDQACEPLTVGKLLRQVPLGRRALEQAFKRIVGRTLTEEITRVRMQRARLLLTETDLSITEIADRCGYDHASRFSHAFKRHHDLPPLRYRQGRVTD